MRGTLAVAPEFERLLVLPEGIFLNYMLRKKCSTYVHVFLPLTLKNSERIMKSIKESPPDYVLLISRDTREHGMERLGDSRPNGSELIKWIDWNCSITHQIGGDPLDYRQRGAILLKRNLFLNE
jgi:hypothetical protein